MAWKLSSRGHALLDAVDHRQLGVALLGLLQQPLRLVEQARVLSATPMLAATVSAGARRRRRRRSRARGSRTAIAPSTRSPPRSARQHATAPGRCPARGSADAPALVDRVDDHAAGCVLDDTGAALPGSSRSVAIAQAHAVLEHVERLLQRARPRRRTSGCRCRRCANTSRSLSPTRSTIAWKSSWPRHALLDAVDHRQLGVALLGFLQQALGLVEQPRVLQRHAHARGEVSAGARRTSPKACSRSWFSSATSRATRSPASIGTTQQAPRPVGARPDAGCRPQLLLRRARQHGRFSSR